MNAYVNQYKNNQVLNASPEQILIMLFDGAIRFCRQAMMAHEQQDYKQMAERISKVMAIVCEFSNSLNREVGGEIAENLDALYSYMTRELTRANLKKEKDALESVEKILLDLREGFAGAVEVNRSQQMGAREPAMAGQGVSASF